MITCKACAKQFEEDAAVINLRQELAPVINGVKYYLPAPTLCFECRQQRRLAFRNERKIYKRKCDHSGKEIVSTYSPDKPFKVYEPEVWWGDQWNAEDYGQVYDFNRPFFEQYAELLLKVPKLALINTNNENSRYTHLETDTRNCYMNFGGHYNDNCHYNLHALKCNNCLDSYWIGECSFCYECFKCENCNNCKYCFWCFNSNDCYFCNDCKSCSDCFGCSGLRHKKFCIFNEQYSEEDYQQKLNEILSSEDKFNEAKTKSEELWLKTPRRALIMDNCENCLGDYMENCKNCYNCFELHYSQDCVNCEVGFEVTDCLDSTRFGYGIERTYELMGGTYIKNTYFSYYCFNGNSEIYYSSDCMGCSDIFGCAGMNKKQYCIFNQQYSKEEYYELVPKIIEHMKSTGEWGEFFPVILSPYGYNEVVANEYLPLNEEEAKANGFNWSSYEPEKIQAVKSVNGKQIPFDNKIITKEILDWAINGDISGKPFKIIPPEYAFYKEQSVNFPRLHPDTRHEIRMKKRTPSKLFDHECEKCSTTVKTTYSPNRPERVYCEECYLSEVY